MNINTKITELSNSMQAHIAGKKHLDHELLTKMHEIHHLLQNDQTLELSSTHKHQLDELLQHDLQQLPKSPSSWFDTIFSALFNCITLYGAQTSWVAGKILGREMLEILHPDRLEGIITVQRSGKSPYDAKIAITFERELVQGLDRQDNLSSCTEVTIDCNGIDIADLPNVLHDLSCSSKLKTLTINNITCRDPTAFLQRLPASCETIKLSDKNLGTQWPEEHNHFNAILHKEKQNLWDLGENEHVADVIIYTLHEAPVVGDTSSHRDAGPHDKSSHGGSSYSGGSLEL